MSVRSDYPELVRISNGMGVHILEDAEDQARRALDELARLRAAADEPDPRFRGHEAYITFDHEADREPDLERKPWQLVIPSPDGRAYERRAWTPEPLVHAAIKWGSDRGIGITVIVWAPNPKPAASSNEWTAAWVAAGRPGELGESIAAATTAEIARLKRTLDDRNEWMKDQAEQLSSLLLAIPRPLRNLIAKRADRIRGEVYTAASPTSPTGGDQ